jgi:hypothetical protein
VKNTHEENVALTLKWLDETLRALRHELDEMDVVVFTLKRLHEEEMYGEKR